MSHKIIGFVTGSILTLLLGCFYSTIEEKPIELHVFPYLESTKAVQFDAFLRYVHRPPGDASSLDSFNFDPKYILDPLFTDDHQFYHVQEIRTANPELYLFFLEVQGEASDSYLCTFSQNGQLIDFQELRSVSFDGNVSLSMVDSMLLEATYYDFLPMDKDLKVIGQTGGLPFYSSLVKQPKRFKAPRDYYFFENFQLNDQGFLSRLEVRDSIAIERTFAQASLRVYSWEELKQMPDRRLRYIAAEIKASHYYSFPENAWYRRYFRKTDWYQPIRSEYETYLSPVERINLERIKKVRQERG